MCSLQRGSAFSLKRLIDRSGLTVPVLSFGVAMHAYGLAHKDGYGNIHSSFAASLMVCTINIRMLYGRFQSLTSCNLFLERTNTADQKIYAVCMMHSLICLGSVCVGIACKLSFVIVLWWIVQHIIICSRRARRHDLS